MSEDGYEVMGPPAGGGAVPPPPAPIPAFPEAASSKPATPPPPPPKVTAPPPPPAAAKAAPPPPPPAAVKMGPVMINSKTASVMDKKSKQSSYSRVSVMETAALSDELTQRPNGCDTCQLAMVFFLTILVIGVAIPVIFAGNGKMDIPAIYKKLKRV